MALAAAGAAWIAVGNSGRPSDHDTCCMPVSRTAAPRWCLALDQRRTGGQPIGQHDRRGPAVHDNIVKGERLVMLVRAEPHQPQPDQRSRCQVDRVRAARRAIASAASGRCAAGRPLRSSTKTAAGTSGSARAITARRTHGNS